MNYMSSNHDLNIFRYGIVLKKLELTDGSAATVLVECVNANPLHWGAWIELAVLVTDKDMVFQ